MSRHCNLPRRLQICFTITKNANHFANSCDFRFTPTKVAMQTGNFYVISCVNTARNLCLFAKLAIRCNQAYGCEMCLHFNRRKT